MLPSSEATCGPNLQDMRVLPISKYKAAKYKFDCYINTGISIIVGNTKMQNSNSSFKLQHNITNLTTKLNPIYSQNVLHIDIELSINIRAKVRKVGLLPCYVIRNMGCSLIIYNI